MKFADAQWIFGQFPPAVGIYHVMQGDDLIYIGSSSNLRDRQIKHKTTPWYLFLEKHNVAFTWFFCRLDLPIRIELGMIQEMRPMCNLLGNSWERRVIKPFVFGPGWSAAILAERAAVKCATHDHRVTDSIPDSIPNGLA